MRTLPAFVAILLLAAAPASQQAGLKPHALFGDHMVLQRDIAIPVWGTAEPGEEIAVSIAGQKKTAKAGVDGKWKAVLDPLKAGGPLEMTLVGRTSVTLKDILVGEVWICSGQSNMEWPVDKSIEAAREIGAAEYPKIRLFTVPKKQSATPQADVVGAWKECTPQNVPKFSAVAYFFGRDLQKAIEVPVGLIHTSWGGTPAEAWTSRRMIESVAEIRSMPDDYAKRKELHAQVLEAHKAAAEKAKAEGKPAPKAPGGPGWEPSVLYNAMIAPIVPYAIRGAIWYQGESNASRAKQYEALFPAMIRNWREDWGQGEFPFLFVQLANFYPRKAEPGESAWAELREAQARTLSLPKTGMAVIIDIGEAADIHPRNKQDVGKRLALAAEHVAYGRDLVYSGPMYDSMKIEGAKARLSFKHAGGGLVAKGEKLTGFAVAGEDRKFVWAEASIDGNTVVVSSPAVDKPVAVRYAWADNPECNLYNKEGLPASPFRTDRP